MTDNLFTDIYTLTQDCVVCKKPFSFPKPERGRYPVCCSDLCKSQRIRDQVRNSARRRNSRPIVSCERCSKPFKRYGTGKFCSVECRHATSLERRKLRPSASGKHRSMFKTCKACDNSFSVKRDNDKFLCSEVCQNDWARIKQKPASFSLYRKAPGKWVPASFDSLFPVHEFSPAKVRRMRIRFSKIERISLIKVLNRDDWTCQICGDETPKSLRGTKDPKAPVVDHIVPLSKGGRHIYSNLQCACHECNSRKGSKFDVHAL